MLLLVKIFAITLAWALVQSNQREKLLFLQKSGEQNESLLVVTWTETNEEIEAGCEFYTDKELINEVLQSSKDASIQTISEDEMQDLMEDCTELSQMRRRRESGDEEDSSSTIASTMLMDENEIETTTDISTDEPTTAAVANGMPIIFPGTKWCGAGDRAKNYDDLGLHQDTDRCCRAHDNCDDLLESGETRNNFTNNYPFTRLSCKCDHDFYDCLDRVNSVTSNTIGNMYFNVLRTQCYELNYPFTTKCKKYRTFLKLKCVEYERNTKAPKEYQWIPARKYTKIPIPGPLTVDLPF